MSERLVTQWVLDRKSGYQDSITVDRMDVESGECERRSVLIPKQSGIDCDALTIEMVEYDEIGESQQLRRDGKLH